MAKLAIQRQQQSYIEFHRIDSLPADLAMEWELRFMLDQRIVGADRENPKKQPRIPFHIFKHLRSFDKRRVNPARQEHWICLSNNWLPNES